MKIKVLGCLAFGLAASMAANAQTETLFYTGNDVTMVIPDGPLSVGGNISGSLTLGTPLGDNLSAAQVNPTAFSFNGGLSSASGALDYFLFSTGPSGAITGWIFALTGPSASDPTVTLSEGSQSSQGGSGNGDEIELDYADQNGSYSPKGFATTAGQWSATTTVAAPEIDPTSAVSGLMLLLGTMAVLRGRAKAV